MDWKTVKTEYITDGTSSYRKLASKYGIPRSTLEHRARVEGWSELKRRHYGRVMAKTLEKAEKNEVDRMTRLLTVSDKLLERIEFIADSEAELSPQTVDVLAKALKSLKDIQKTDRDTDGSHIEVVLGDGVAELAR